MRKWIGRAVVMSLLAGGLGAIFLGRDVVSYATTLLGIARRGVKESVPLEFQLQRARDLGTGILRQLDTLVREFSENELSTEKLHTRIQEIGASGALPGLRDRLLELKAAVQGGGQVVRCGAEQLPRGDAERRLASLFHEYKARRDLLTYLKAAYDQKCKSGQAMRDRILSLRSEKEKLDADIERISAMVQMAKAADSGRGAVEAPENTAQIAEILNDVEERCQLIARTRENTEKLLPPTCDDGGAQPVQQLLPSIDAYLAKEEAPSATAQR